MSMSRSLSVQSVMSLARQLIHVVPLPFPSPSFLSSPNLAMARITYVPLQTIGELSIATSTEEADPQVAKNALFDFSLLFQNLKFIPSAFKSERRPDPLPGIPATPEPATVQRIIEVLEVNGLDICLIGILVTILPTGNFIFGWRLWQLMFVLGAIVYIALLPFATPKDAIVKSKFHLRHPHRHDREKWLYIGSPRRYSHSFHAQESCDRLAMTFQRPITAITVNSYGYVYDTVFRLGLQSCETDRTFDVIKKQLNDADIDKVVVIAHSLGGVVLSNTMNKLLESVAPELAKKLEIFTFGSAAFTFPNPLDPPEQDVNTPTPTFLIPIIEHYANALDPIARIGVIHHTRKRPGRRYAGKVFIQQEATGALFDEHYLTAMFPAREGRDQGVHGMPRMSPFLDQMVCVDETTAKKRAETFVDATMPFEPGTIDMNVDDEMNAWRRRSNADMYAKSRRASVVEETEKAVEEGSGRTVRQLSRLWKYVGGGTA
ncbi:hypothetical protein K402DRAFT_162210 [Aulographum hederae CBS 113979]|uniref:DUF676 domain-containing protein n=1 Tax=Aulographum hederae CBS 113979 TaxID=1176131 RepID=A0A6G1GSH7_9PEZI|nr:hypothetical protein K402DRAFT_162210 [Aulographum hederae CBS 113979]